MPEGQWSTSRSLLTSPSQVYMRTYSPITGLTGRSEVLAERLSRISHASSALPIKSRPLPKTRKYMRSPGNFEIAWRHTRAEVLTVFLGHVLES